MEAPPFALRLATLDDQGPIDSLMKASTRELFPAFYDERQTASSARYIAHVDPILIADETYFVIEADGEIVACGGWSRRDKLFSGSADQEARARFLDPASEPARIRAMFVRGDWARRGLGTRILDACQAAARAAGFTNLALMATLPGFPPIRALRVPGGRTDRYHASGRCSPGVRVDGDGDRFLKTRVGSTSFTPAKDKIRWSDLPSQSRAPSSPDAEAPPARIYLHGLGWTGAAKFARVAVDPALADSRSLLVDLAGHGMSDRPRSFGYTLEEHAVAVAALLDAEQLRGVDLVGHSLGGSIAIVLASRRPDLVARIVVVEANLDPMPPSSTGLGSQQISSYTEAAWLAGGWAGFIARNPAWAPSLRQCDPLAIHRSAVGLITGSRPTVRALLMSLAMPRTFIRGARGELLNERDRLAETGVRIVELPDAGHMVMLDQPEMFAGALVEARD